MSRLSLLHFLSTKKVFLDTVHYSFSFPIRSIATMSIPTTQRALRIHENGGPEVVKFDTDVPVPTVGPDTVLVKTRFAGVNFIDTYFRRGLYPSQFPSILGQEASGDVVAVGPQVTNFKVGDRVGVAAGKAYAEYIAVSESSKVVKLPDSISYEIAAGAFIQVLTALALVKEAHTVKKGDYILVHAAAGGTGSLLVQLAKQRGAIVIGTTSTAEKAQRVKALGADYVINYKEEDIVSKVAEYTNGHGADGIFDGVGKSTFPVSLQAIARKGTLVSFGNASGAVPDVPLFSLTPKNVKLVRPSVFNYIVTPEEWKAYTTEMFELLDGKLDLKIYKVYPFETGNDAITTLETGTTTGKLLIQTS